MSSAKPLCYEDDPDWPMEVYDNVTVRAGENELAGIVEKIWPRRRAVTVSFGAPDDPVLDLVLRRTATVPAEVLTLVGRGM